MGIHQKSSKINIKGLKKATTLTGTFLRKKQIRDKELINIIKGKDQRLLLLIGPCSSDNEKAVLEYAKRLSKLQEEVSDKLFIIMRVYTAKPRTSGIGYKGLVHQPNFQGLPDLINGIKMVRKLHYRVITETGLTTADELVYTSNYPLIDDLVSYHTIGARSVEDQEHRFLASGIDTPVGMKNPTSGNLNVMFNGIYAAQNKQNFIYHNEEVETDGNPYAHVILRGAINEYGEHIPNYYYDNLLKVIAYYKEMHLINPFVIIDTNHDNSGKNHLEQIRIVRQTLLNRDWNKIIKQHVRGFMIESYLEDGRQDKPDVFGKSITDPCLGWKKTELLVKEIYQTLANKEI
ncbi:3-deoxy-7-phosphoheptulonate synthase [Streptococcus marimammalium]|uniref:3-deoxy-7-phosphoheptulonate synthase n=1 Tax=Streptococcus marimammalium TaxID=269666 RepID=UPI00036AA62C|nr:3-deoxy-7-phosphoheptulonate synthase [Streptococcus marimammalium]